MSHDFILISHDLLTGSVPKGNLAQRGVSGLAEGVDSLTGGTAAQQFVDRNGLGGWDRGRTMNPYHHL